MTEKDKELFNAIIDELEDRADARHGVWCWAGFGAGCLVTTLGVIAAYQLGAL